MKSIDIFSKRYIVLYVIHYRLTNLIFIVCKTQHYIFSIIRFTTSSNLARHSSAYLFLYLSIVSSEKDHFSISSLVISAVSLLFITCLKFFLESLGLYEPPCNLASYPGWPGVILLV